MRLRNKPWAKPLIDANPQYVVTEPEKFAGKWQEVLKKSSRFLLKLERARDVSSLKWLKNILTEILSALKCRPLQSVLLLKSNFDAKLPNLQLVCANGSGLTEFFNEGEVSGIYLNFSDPWPKKRNEKRRLTYKTFLESYENVLNGDGRIEFKTDNRGLFEYSLCSMNEFGMHFDGVWLDLHDSEEAKENVMTEYEEKFSQKGQPIYKLTAHF